MKWGELYSKLKESGLFDHGRFTDFSLKDSVFYCSVYSQSAPRGELLSYVQWYWYKNQILDMISFEEVLNNVSEEIRAELIFHMDYFS